MSFRRSREAKSSEIEPASCEVQYFATKLFVLSLRETTNDRTSAPFAHTASNEIVGPHARRINGFRDGVPASGEPGKWCGVSDEPDPGNGDSSATGCNRPCRRRAPIPSWRNAIADQDRSGNYRLSTYGPRQLRPACG